MKIIGNCLFAAASCRCNSIPVCPGSRTSSTRQVGPSGRGASRNSSTELSRLTRKPADRSRLPSDACIPGSSSTTITVGGWSFVLCSITWSSLTCVSSPAIQQHSGIFATRIGALGFSRFLGTARGPGKRLDRLPTVNSPTSCRPNPADGVCILIRSYSAGLPQWCSIFPFDQWLVAPRGRMFRSLPPGRPPSSASPAPPALLRPEGPFRRRFLREPAIVLLVQARRSEIYTMV